MFYLSTKDICHAKSLFWSDKKKLMWADWGKDALHLFNENCAWDNSNVLGLFISKVILSGIDYVQDFANMVWWPTDIYCSEKGFSLRSKEKYWKWYFTELTGVWWTVFSTSFLGLLTSKKMIIIILIKMIIIIIINFSQTLTVLCSIPHIFKLSKSATLIVYWTSCETSQCCNFTQGFFTSVGSTVGILISWALSFWTTLAVIQGTANFPSTVKQYKFHPDISNHLNSTNLFLSVRFEK